MPMIDFFGTWGGHIAGFGGFLAGLAAVLYARARVAQFERAVLDLDWQQVAELSLDVAKLKKAAQKWQNNANAQEKVTSKELFEQAMAQKIMQNAAPQPQIRMLEK